MTSLTADSPPHPSDPIRQECWAEAGQPQLVPVHRLPTRVSARPNDHLPAGLAPNGLPTSLQESRTQSVSRAHHPFGVVTSGEDGTGLILRRYKTRTIAANVAMVPSASSGLPAAGVLGRNCKSWQFKAPTLRTLFVCLVVVEGVWCLLQPWSPLYSV